MKQDTYYYSDGSVLHNYDPNKTFHRIDGPAIEFANGNKWWYQNNQLHRTDGPAVEWPNGYKCWYQNGQIHRTDGPAVEHTNGYKTWCLFGKEYNKPIHHRMVKCLVLF